MILDIYINGAFDEKPEVVHAEGVDAMSNNWSKGLGVDVEVGQQVVARSTHEVQVLSKALLRRLGSLSQDVGRRWHRHCLDGAGLGVVGNKDAESEQSSG